jgi:pyruvate-ferredoxin/flavodoxin oxidoreductase
VNPITVDGNEAVGLGRSPPSEVIAIYPITPRSTMGELCDEWSHRGPQERLGLVPQVTEMQSEGGAAGAVHGALQAVRCTTFTASQGLLLMIPNMYKIAGELTPFCMHVAARTLATHALSIFGDHSDVMACRQIGFALLASAAVQEAHDFAAIAHAATLAARVPFLHFFDGFRTSHEVRKIERSTTTTCRFLVDEEAVPAHRGPRLDSRPSGAARHRPEPRHLLQAREAANLFYDRLPASSRRRMARFAERHRPPVPALRLRRAPGGRARRS